MTLTSWQPQDAWLTILLVSMAITAILSALAVSCSGTRTGRWIDGSLIGFVVIVAGAAAARINLAVDRGHEGLVLLPIVLGFGLASAAILVLIPGVIRSVGSARRTAIGGIVGVAAVGMLVVAVSANLEVG
jgi:hypothetical protein